LQISNSKAERTLEEIAALKGNVGFCASITLQEWKKGTLRLYSS
jgi:hypothetical protein